MLENAVRVCDAKFGTLLLIEDRLFRSVARLHTPARACAEFQMRRGSVQAERTRLAFSIVVSNKEWSERRRRAEGAPRPGPTRQRWWMAGVPYVLGVPMLKDGELIGAIVIYRQEVLPFTDKQIGLVQNFAAQAVIAIENARLLNELRQSLEQQTATADVLRVISASPGDLQPVFGIMLENATRICEANFGNMFLIEDGTFRTVAMHNAPAAYSNARTAAAIPSAGGQRPRPPRVVKGRGPCRRPEGGANIPAA